MKINPGWRPFGKEIVRNENAPSQHLQQKSFSDTMRQHDDRASQEQLQRILEQIHQQAERLNRSMTVRELRQYKLLVKQYLEETARRGIRLRETRGWDRRGRAKRYKLLEEIDQELLGLAEELLDTEQGRIELLRKVGEIRGMLINLAF
ncbi:YaaR family protein [Paenibacillus ginsengihumi]|uniref:YaaR family protein n=1 Tax=Paenibacillus ginsengihumi TaxID=431596 RepID=UPI000376F094|nr:YaaR family protein [Paenibacillus ginsengihumi]